MDVRAVSDSQVLSCKVNQDENRVIFHTACPDPPPRAYRDLIFERVLAFDLRGEVFRAEIFDVDEVPIEEILAEEKEKFQKALQANADDFGRLRIALALHLKELDVRGFKVLSKTFYAWVLAADMHVENAEHAHEPAGL